MQENSSTRLRALRYCAELVDCIEINSTFYRFPVARHCASWAERVDGLRTCFSAKLPQEFTHRGSTDAAAAREVCSGFAPLREAGRLTTLLAQFSYRFERSPSSLTQLAWLRDNFAAVAPLTVEVRHRSWGTPEALDELRGLDIAVANLDYPGAASGFGPRVTDINGPNGLAYFRVHGRNSDAWFDKKAGRDEVYNYEYTGAEVAELAGRATELGGAARETLVVANNHFHGKAMKLVLQLLALYRQARVQVPGPLLDAYPDLREIAEPQKGQLF